MSENRSKQTPRRIPRSAFKPGQSGNPGGRPKGVGHVRELARAHTDLAIQTLAEIAAHGKPDAARVAAANALLDQGWGRPQPEAEINERPPIQFILNRGPVGGYDPLAKQAAETNGSRPALTSGRPTGGAAKLDDPDELVAFDDIGSRTPEPTVGSA